ncbi:MAG: hypothetical protein A2V67_01090 [Deltaproteobacteria bacterium RBG_13_61_14]|nr:MAG: hypothetical protein A2V67_01090 [Deltaproteobacteria bacterium RBG_13_61_14]
MRKKTMLLPLALFLLAIATPALAQNRAGAVTLSPFVGGYMFACFQHLDNNWYYGLRAGYNFTEHWGAEGLFGYVPTESNARGFDGREVSVFRYGGDILYNFMPKKKFVPFLAAGFGGIQINDPSGLNDHERGMIDYGAGLKYFIVENVALRADVRHDLLCEFDKPCSNLEYTGGVTILLGGKKQVVAAAPPAPPPAAVPAPAPRPVEAAPAPAPKPKPKVILIELLDTHFEFDKSALTPLGKEILVKNIRTLKANPNLNILIAGYTSASGSYEYNQKLSERRATTVRQALIEGGIAPERLTKIGYGENRPATYEQYPADLESRAAKSNMRVLFTIVVK